MAALNRTAWILALVVVGEVAGGKAMCRSGDETGPPSANVGTRGTRADELLFGGDISALTKIEEAGGVFRDSGQPGDAIRIMAGHGGNCFRLRLFVNPTGRNVVVNDLPYTIALAKRIKAANAKLLLNFHYSDTWADPGHQVKPEAWKDLSFDALEKKVYEYTRDCILQMKREGVLPEFVQVGNEITPGMLWPDGKLYGVGEPEKQWDKFARLLKAGVRGVREAAGPNGDVRIVIHIDKGGDWTRTKWFFEHIEQRRVPYDIIGLSYYPWWHGSIEDLRENLRETARAFNKDIFVVETAYPYRSMGWPKKYKKEHMAYPMSPEGQRRFLSDLIAAVRETPDKRGIGVLWWYPESIPVTGLRVWHGGATALFDSDGNILPAARVLERE